MAAALEKVAGKAATALIDWVVDPAIARIVTSWPARIDAARARALGLLPETDFEAIVRDYVRDNPEAIALKTVI
jgi:nucleoside-diphosphate-sugar epimerase